MTPLWIWEEDYGKADPALFIWRTPKTGYWEGLSELMSIVMLF